MDTRKLGRSGLSVSPLCLGTMMFGDQTDEKEAKRIVGHARDAGAVPGMPLAIALDRLERNDLVPAVTAAWADDDAAQSGFEIVRSETGSLLMLGVRPEAPLCLCAWCHRARGAEGDWQEVGLVLRQRYDLELTHGICQTCVESHFADFLDG